MQPFLVSAFFALSLAAPAHAGEHGACKADLEKFCAGVEPGEGRMMKCLKEHEAELSEGCRAMKGGVKDKMQEKGRELEAACKADKEKLCKDVEPGEGRIVKCMKEHEAELSEKCRGMMKEKHEKMQGMKDKAEACRADKERFCKDVKPGEGRIVECLKAHEAELSEGCRAAKIQKHEKHDKKEKTPEAKK